MQISLSIHAVWSVSLLFAAWISTIPLLAIAKISKPYLQYSLRVFSSPEPKYTNGPSFVAVHTFKLRYLWSQLASLDQILRIASLGWGNAAYGFGEDWPSLTYNEENDVSTFSRLFLIRSFLYLQVKRPWIKSWMSSNFGQIRPLTTELAALECLKNFPYTYNGKMVSPC